MAQPMQMQNQQNFNPFQYNQPEQRGFGSQLSDFFLGTPERTGTTQKFTPQQQGAQGQVLQQLMQLLQGGSPAGFEGIEQNARRGFNTQTLPSLAERFAGAGGLGSSGYRNSLKGAGTQLESNLAALRGQMGNQQLSTLLGYGLTPSFDTQMFQKQPGFSREFWLFFAWAWIESLGKAGGQWAGNKLFGSAGGNGDMSELLQKLLPLLGAL